MRDLSKPVVIDSITESVVVFFYDKDTPDYKVRWEGEVYPIYDGTDPDPIFRSNHSSVRETDKNKAECWFYFSFCWRGVWEGRIYPKQEEFWSEELDELADIWKKIESILKERIKADNPEYEPFDA